LAISESNRRKEIRTGGQQAAQQPKVADAAIAQMDAPQQSVLPEQQGIGAIPAPNMRGMAGGGIVAFDRGGRTGDVGPMQYRKYAMDRAQELGLDPSFVNAIFTYESEYKPNAKSPTGPIGIGQLTAATGAAYGVSKEDRKDPYKNMDASLAYMADLNKKYNGDQQKMAVAYNQGETFLNNNLNKNGGELVPQKLGKKEPITYLQRVGQIMSAAIPSAQAGELPQAPAQVAPQAPAQVAPQAAQTQVNPQGRFPLPARTSGGAQAPESGTTGEVDRSVLGQLKRIYQGMGTAGERIAPKEQLYSPSGQPLEDTRGFFERAASGLGLSEEAQRNISNTLNAGAGYTAPLRIPGAVGKLSAAEEAARLAKNAQADEAAAAAAAKVANVRLPPNVSVKPGGVAALSEEDKIRRGLATPVPVSPKPTVGLEALSDAEKAKRGLTPQGTKFPLSPEAIEMNRRLAAARAAQKTAPIIEETGAAGKTYPLGTEAVEMNQKLAAAKNAQALRNMKADEQAAANAAKLAEETKLGTKAEEGLEAINATQKANRLNQVIRPANAIVDAARLENAADVIGGGLPSGRETEQVAPVPSDIDRERDSLQRRYPITERAEPAPQQDDMAREMTSLQNRYPAPPSSPQEIIKMAKEETPKSAATKGFTSDDWLNLGFNLLAGKSQYAMENLGTAGVATLAAKREREKEERTAALTEAIHTPEAERVINRLMQEKGLDYAAALEFYYKNKNYIDTRMYGYNRAAEAKQAVAETGAGARVQSAEISAAPRDAATLARERDSMEKAIENLDKSMVGIMKNKNPTDYQQKLGEIYSRYPNVAPQVGGKPEVYTGAKVVNVRPSP
jgi:hypothetical protein